MSIETMKQALEALENTYALRDDVIAAKESLRQAIAVYESAPPECQTEAEKKAFAFGWWKAMEVQQAEKQEPVAWQVHPFDYGIGHEGVYARTDRLEQVEAWKRKGWNVQPLYTHPQPKREPLTVDGIWRNDHIMSLNADLGLGIDDWIKIVAAIEAAHGIKEKNT